MTGPIAEWPALCVRFLDSIALFWLPAGARLAVWGAVCGAVSMMIYRATSPQAVVARARANAAEARAAMAHYDGDARGLLPLACRAIALALRPIGLAVGPTLLAALPVALVFAGLSDPYNLRFVLPAAGSALAIKLALRVS